ncbi:LPXTG-motif cell wall anchor domain-containing protein [Clostridium cavendishii DSM 21758]|uniref:LPXTG-motif cell wall anchor domain-containing protein n=1 Tax=Clostridium cavendishii DSM 21758 TaxID=1121302 RepID=A0A1M6UEW8_9CLOT|nr:LPXTG cell wall anchor domain-containing protein [Clostridium cavendishii]SHK67754.1 LPXTG-motif cell wall anchor domain-containing protein [Clostridium cavendishii DSM 21758]
MKKIKKLLLLPLVYVFIILVLPINTFAVITTDKVQVPKYLNYNELYINFAAQYKDKTLINYSDKTLENGYYKYSNNSSNLAIIENNSAKKDIPFSSKSVIDVGKVIGDSFYSSQYKYNFNNNKLEELHNNIYAAKLAALDIINKKYNTNLIDYELDIKITFDNNGDEYYIFNPSEYNEKNYTGIFNYKGFEYVEKDFSIRSVTFDKNNNIQMIQRNIVNSDNNNYKVLNADELRIVKLSGSKVVFNNTCSIKNSGYTLGDDYYYLTDLSIVGDNVYVTKGYYIEQYSWINNTYKLTKESKIKDFNKVTSDINGSAWIITKENNKAFVCKFLGSDLIPMYEVDSSMQQLYVYDDSHLTVAGSKGFTTINLSSSTNVENNKDNNNTVDSNKDNNSITKKETPEVTTNVINAQKNSSEGEKKHNPIIKTKKELPQTGSNMNKNLISLLGLLFVVSGSFVLYKEK